MGELEELEQEEIDSQLLNIEEPGTLPSVPSASVPAASAKGKCIILMLYFDYHSLQFLTNIPTQNMISK